MNAFLPKLKSGFDDEEGETVKDGEGVIELYELDKNGKLFAFETLRDGSEIVMEAF